MQSFIWKKYSKSKQTNYLGFVKLSVHWAEQYKSKKVVFVKISCEKCNGDATSNDFNPIVSGIPGKNVAQWENWAPRRSLSNNRLQLVWSGGFSLERWQLWSYKVPRTALKSGCLFWLHLLVSIFVRGSVIVSVRLFMFRVYV